MKKTAVILFPGSKYNICCDIGFLSDFMKYIMNDDKHMKEVKMIVASLREGLSSKKYGPEPYGTFSLKPFFNRENDRIICNVQSRKNKTKCIIMSEIYYSKKTQNVDKKLGTRYKIVSKYEYEIVEQN